MSRWIMSLMRRGSLLALMVMLTTGLLGLHLHHPAQEKPLGHDHGHGHDHGGHDHPEGGGLDDEGHDSLVFHLHAVDAMTLPERPLLGTDDVAVLLDRRIPTDVPPVGPAIDVDPPPVRTAA